MIAAEKLVIIRATSPADWSHEYTIGMRGTLLAYERSEHDWYYKAKVNICGSTYIFAHVQLEEVHEKI